MRRKGHFRYVMGILLCAALAAGSMGAAAFSEDLSSETAIASDDPDMEDVWVLEDRDQQEALPLEEELSDAMILEKWLEVFPGDAALDEEPEESGDESDMKEEQGELPAGLIMDEEAEEVRANNYPTVRKLTYTGEAQELLDASNVPEGIRYDYSLDGETYGTEIPAGTDAGEYIVYVKAAHDEGSQALELAVTIEKAEVVFTPPAAAK